MYSAIIGFIVIINEFCLAADDDADGGADGDTGGDGPELPINNPNVRIRTGCNFYENEAYGATPFSQIKREGEPCTITLDPRGDTFMYGCDGPSDPVDCPYHVKADGEDRDFLTLFNTSTVTNKINEFDEHPHVYHIVTGAYTNPFSVSCVCNKADGTTETMIVKSGFKMYGIIGSLLLVAGIMMNI